MTDSHAGLPAEWRTPTPHLTLDPQEVHVWRGILDRSSSELQAYWDVLSPSEQQRAQRFRSPKHQDQFIAAHGMVRHIISFYVNVPPAALRFDKGPHGKPFLDHPDSTGLIFNLSHSHNLALFALTSMGEIGVDLEHNQRTIHHHALADRIMSQEEKSIFHGLPAHEQKSAFLSCWTRKEAFVKANGRGLGSPLHEFSVAFTPVNRPEMGTIHDSSDARSEWSMYAIFPDDQYTAALVVKGSPNMLRYWHFSDDHRLP